MGGESVEDVFTSCAIGIPTSLQVLENYTFLAHIDLTNAYQSTYNWGNITLRKDKETIHFSQRYLPSRKVCHIYRLPKKTVKTHSYPHMTCNFKDQKPYGKAHTKLPLGWFLLRGREAFTYIPAKVTRVPCTRQRLTVLMPSKGDLVQEVIGKAADGKKKPNSYLRNAVLRYLFSVQER